MISRRGFFAGLVSALAAPAIVRAASLMPVKALVLPTEEEVRVFLDGRVIAEGGIFIKPTAWSSFDPVRSFHFAREMRLTAASRKMRTFGGA